VILAGSHASAEPTKGNDVNTEAHTALTTVTGSLQRHNVDNLTKGASIGGPCCSETVRNESWL